MTTYPQLLPFLSANGGATIISWDAGGGVLGNDGASVAMILGVDLTVLPRAPGQPGIPSLCGSAAPGEIAGLILRAGTTVRFLKPQSDALAAAGLATVTGA